VADPLEQDRSVPDSSFKPSSQRAWLVGPWFDLFCIANIAWPILIVLSEAFQGLTELQFWQIYFITTPHRWITLFLVFLDRERFRERQKAFLAIAFCVVAVCLSVRLSTGALTCLLAIDYIWNAWHFAAQHHGVYRIYGRLAHQGDSAGMVLEKWSMRAFILYVTLRIATATGTLSHWEYYFQQGDWMVAIIPVWLLIRDLVNPATRQPGRLAYLLSVSLLYLGLLTAVHERRLGLVLALTMASALFHATEYLALVTWSLQKRYSTISHRMGILSYFIPRWGITLFFFAMILGAGGWMLDQDYVELWLSINVVVAFLHYAYDGLIWRHRTPLSLKESS
jgi:hypothetical protein